MLHVLLWPTREVAGQCSGPAERSSRPAATPAICSARRPGLRSSRLGRRRDSAHRAWVLKHLVQRGLRHHNAPTDPQCWNLATIDGAIGVIASQAKNLSCFAHRVGAALDLSLHESPFQADLPSLRSLPTFLPTCASETMEIMGVVGCVEARWTPQARSGATRTMEPCVMTSPREVVALYARCKRRPRLCVATGWASRYVVPLLVPNLQARPRERFTVFHDAYAYSAGTFGLSSRQHGFELRWGHQSLAQPISTFSPFSSPLPTCLGALRWCLFEIRDTNNAGEGRSDRTSGSGMVDLSGRLSNLRGEARRLFGGSPSP